MGSAVRSCVLATRLAQSLDLPTADVQATFYTALLHHVGCVGHAHETAQLFGDDLAANVAAGRTGSGSAERHRGDLPALAHAGTASRSNGFGWRSPHSPRVVGGETSSPPRRANLGETRPDGWTCPRRPDQSVPRLRPVAGPDSAGRAAPARPCPSGRASPDWPGSRCSSRASAGSNSRSRPYDVAPGECSIRASWPASRGARRNGSPTCPSQRRAPRSLTWSRTRT